jgi:hypothetical protein
LELPVRVKNGVGTLSRVAGMGLLAAFVLPGQYTKHNLSFGMGAAAPRGDLNTFFHDSFNLNVGYGYRFHPNFQIDAGLDTVFFAGRVNDYVPTDFGDLAIRDYQFLVPVGGRAILPLARGRFHLYGGGGFAYLRYTELLRQPSPYWQIDCRYCGSRHGIGYYATAGLNFALDQGQHFRVGAGMKVYRGNTDGDPVGAVPPIRTKDHWNNLFAEFTFAF